MFVLLYIELMGNKKTDAMIENTHEQIVNFFCDFNWFFSKPETTIF
jgi:hypothetical protein